MPDVAPALFRIWDGENLVLVSAQFWNGSDWVPTQSVIAVEPVETNNVLPTALPFTLGS